MSRPILILGGSGFIGNAIYRELSAYFYTLGTYNNNTNYKNNSNFIHFNHQKNELTTILKKFNPIGIQQYQAATSFRNKYLKYKKKYMIELKKLGPGSYSNLKRNISIESKRLPNGLI